MPKSTPSDVYFTNLRTRSKHNLLDKLNILMKRAGMDSLDFESKFVAIKLHFGEPGNLAYLRPNYAAAVVKRVRELGGKPFLTDCNALYFGKRGNAVDHLQAAIENGFNTLTTGANVIVADGLTGGDVVEVPINLKHVKKAKIGSTIANADVILSLTHFKGHQEAGFGGVLKNVGMGSGSRAGKLEMHSNNNPEIDEAKCIACGMCIQNCPQNAIAYNARHKAEINPKLCIGCGQCIVTCHYGAPHCTWGESAIGLNEKIAEYTYAVLKGKTHFHISFIMNVSPNCDCWGYNDMAIVPDIGMAASLDPVALDRACADLVNKAMGVQGSQLSEREWQQGEDKFHAIHPDSRWEACLEHAEQIGLGTQQYRLIEVD